MLLTVPPAAHLNRGSGTPRSQALRERLEELQAAHQTCERNVSYASARWAGP